MVRKRCNYGPCVSYEGSKTTVSSLRFIKFPSPKTDHEKCERWVEACGRKNFTVSNVTRSTYICNKHFKNFTGPTEDNPDPIPLSEVLTPKLLSQVNVEITSSEKTSNDLIQETPSSEKEIKISNFEAVDETPKPKKRKYVHRKQLCLDEGEKPKILDTLNFSSLSPPIGWCMEVKECGVTFSQQKNGLVVLQCDFAFKEKLIVEIRALGVEIDVGKLFKTYPLETNNDIYKLLLEMNKYKICPGNDDSELVSIYKSRTKNNRKTKSFLFERLNSVYSNDCYGLIRRRNKKCRACFVHRGSLRVLRVRFRGYVNNKKQHKPKRKAKYILSEKSKKEILALKQVFKARLQNEKPGSFMTIFLKQQIKALERSKFGMRWDAMFVKWCSYMKNKSKSTYDALKKSGTILLPTVRTLYNRCHTVDNKSGFNEDVFNEMIKETNINNLPEKDKYFVLLLDEMSVNPDLVCHKNTGRITGFKYIIERHNALDEMERKVKGVITPPLATHILQLMIRGVTNNIKVPFAHFPTTNATSSDLYCIIWEAISWLENSGFRILAVVGDGASSNRKFFRMCATMDQNSQIPFFTTNLHAADEERKLFFISDAPHLIKTVRNCFSNSGANSKSRNLWLNNQDISWKVILRLYYTQLKLRGEFKHVSKLTYGHVFLNSYSRMKVNYAAQILSESVASGIETLFKKDKSKYEETLKFIRIFDKFFDLCNVKNCIEAQRYRKPNKRPYKDVNDERLKWLEGDFIKYLDDWEEEVTYRPGKFTKSERDRMLLSRETIAGLKMTALSTVAIVRFLLNKGAAFVLTQHLNQDPLEQHFGKHRAAGGRNTNPSVCLFEANIDKLKSLMDLALNAINGNTRIEK